MVVSIAGDTAQFVWVSVLLARTADIADGGKRLGQVEAGGGNTVRVACL